MPARRSIVGRIPVVVRALVVGFVIQIVGVMPFLYMFRLNLEHGSRIPWAAAVEAVVLWLLWRYLRGAGWPASTSATRRRWLRADTVDRRMLPPTVATALLYGLTVVALSFFTALWKPMPVEAFANVLDAARAPAITGLVTLLMIAISAGIVEEAAFRGYLQRPIEERHGPAVAIVLVAFLFALAHAPAGPVLPVMAAGALGWGLLARLSGSIVPGIVVHTLVDANILLWIWLRPDSFEAFLATATESPGGPNARAAGLVALALAAASAVAFYRLHRARAALDSRTASAPEAPAALAASEESVLPA